VPIEGEEEEEEEEEVIKNSTACTTCNSISYTHKELIAEIDCSKAWVCGRSVADILGSNFAGL
jgi:hypothetical protein